MNKEIGIGTSGFVGNLYSKQNHDLVRPTSKELDITNTDSISEFFKLHSDAEVVINFAAYTDTKKAQSEKGNKDGQTWQINVVGTKNLIDICEQRNIYLIQISTDNVFYDKNGPSNESDNPGNDGLTDWYGHTKLKAEEIIRSSNAKYAILRIAYPFGNPNNSRDFCVKLINAIEKGFPLFNDQHFTPTYLPQMFETLEKIIKKREIGIFHSVCSGITTPYQIGLKLTKLLNLQSQVKYGQLKDFELTNGKNTISYLGGLLTSETSMKLGIDFISWEKALDEYCNEYKRKLPDISNR